MIASGIPAPSHPMPAAGIPHAPGFFDSAVNIFYLISFVSAAAVAELLPHNIHTHRIRRRREGRGGGQVIFSLLCSGCRQMHLSYVCLCFSLSSHPLALPFSFSFECNMRMCFGDELDAFPVRGREGKRDRRRMERETRIEFVCQFVCPDANKGASIPFRSPLDP